VKPTISKKQQKKAAKAAVAQAAQVQQQYIPSQSSIQGMINN